jgi:hypothetical protein
VSKLMPLAGRRPPKSRVHVRPTDVSNVRGPLTIDERRRLAGQISMSLCNLEAFRLFWIPLSRRVTARSIQPRRRFRLPPGALEVGVYAYGVKTADVLRDLEDFIQERCSPHDD